MSKEHQDLQRMLREFASERDWEQFHSPKNLAAALSVEAAELLEHFQWQTEEESRSLPEAKRAQIAEELADVFLYLLRLADKLDVDLIASGHSKLVVNAKKYPADLARGSSRKYTEF
jgi:NTP pyrophosphatase (non-canonical NTP hydrolase)